MKYSLTMDIKGVALYVFLSNNAIALLTLHYFSEIAMLSWLAAMSGVGFGLLILILFYTFLTIVKYTMIKTETIPFPFVLVMTELNQDQPNSK